MATGNDNNSWGTNHNNQVSAIFENAIAAKLTTAVTGGTLDLSGSPPPANPSQAGYAHLRFTGVLTANQTVIVPALDMHWIVRNSTTGAFNLFMKVPSGNLVIIPQNKTEFVFFSSTGLRRLSQE